MRRDALVVGINQYPSLKETPTSKAKNLTTPAVDAETIAQLLEADKNFRVIRLPSKLVNNKLQVDPDGMVTADALLEAVTKLFLPEENIDTALLFFAGHGLQKPLGTLKQTLLATSDANPYSKKWNGIILRDLWDIIEESTVKEQIIWLDCCYSGALLNFKDNEFPKQSARKRFLIAASHSSEVAYERFDGKHGVLSGALINELDANKITSTNWITARTLGASIDTELKKYYEETKIPQLPQIRIPDQEIRIIQGKGQPSTNKLEAQKTSEREVPFILPQLDVSTFTGRNDELKQLEELLLNSQGTKFCSIAGLTGVGGIGKSALACYFATLHRADFPDGIICLRVDGKDIDTIARDFARRYENRYEDRYEDRYEEKINLEDERDAATIMQEIFAHRRMLLIFDNAENASIYQLRPGGNKCAVIVTTRDRGLVISLEIPSEGRINIPTLPEADALLLLEKLVGKERVTAEPEAAHELIELAGYLPIAIKIIGSQLSLHERRSLARHADRLKRERQLASMKFGSAEHLDLFACFSISLEYLQPNEVDFFACLSVCAKNGFSLRTAMMATSCDEYTTEDNLNKLYQLSLINYSEIQKDRFVFHPLIHQFAWEKAIELGLQEEAATRHAEYFIEFTQRELNYATAQEIATELDDIILAAQWLQKQKTTSKSQEEDKYKFAICLQPLFEQYGYWEKAVDFMLGFEQLAESNKDWQAVIKFRVQQAKYLSLQGKLAIAEERLKPELIAEILDKIEEEWTRQHSEAKCLNTLGSIVMRQGKFDEAVSNFKRALEIEERLNNQEGLTIALNCLGGLLRRQGNLSEAEEVFKRSYAISEELNDKGYTAFVQHHLGLVFLEQNRLDEACHSLQRSCNIFKELGNQRSLSIVLNSLSGILQKQGKIDGAIAAIQESVAIEEKLNDRHNFVIKLNKLGGLYQQKGQIKEAIQTFGHAITVAEEDSNKQQLAVTLNQLGGLYQQQRQIEQAIQTFERAIIVTQEADNKQQLAITLTQLGVLYQQQGQVEEAIQSFKRVITTVQETDKKQLAITLNKLGGLYQQQGQIEQAIQTFERAITVAQEAGNKQQLAITLTQLGGLYQPQGKVEEAIQCFKRAITIAQETDDNKQLAITLSQLCKLYQEQGRIDETIKSFKDRLQIAQETDDKKLLVITLNQFDKFLQEQGQINEVILSLEQSIKMDEATEGKQVLVILIIKLAGLYQKQGQIEQAIQSFERAIAIAEKLQNKQSLAITLNQLGGFYQEQGQIEQAIQSFERALAIAQEIGNKHSFAITLNQLGGLYQEQGLIEEATQSFEHRLTIEIDKETNDKKSLIMTLNRLCGLYQRQGRIDKAIQYLEYVIAIAQETDHKRQLAITLTQLAGMYQEQGREEKAIQSCEHAIAIAQEDGNKKQLAITLNQLGGLYQQQGQFDKAIQSCEDAVSIAKEINDNKQQLTFILTQLCVIYQEQGKFNEAIESYKYRIRIYKETDNKKQLPITLNKLAGLYQQQKRINEAIISLNESLEIAQQIDDKQQTLIALNQFGGLYKEQRQFDKAIEFFEEAINISQQMDDKYSQAITLKLVVELHRQQGQIEKAIQSLKHIVMIAEEANNRQLLEKILENSIKYILFLCKAYATYIFHNRELIKIRDIEIILRTCYNLCIKIDDKKSLALILYRLGKIMYFKGGEDNFKLSCIYLKESIKYNSSTKHLSKIYTTLGKYLFQFEKFEQAIEELCKAFEIDERSANIEGLKKVTPFLIYSLIHLGRHEEAISFCKRCLLISSDEVLFLEIDDKVSSSKQIPNPNVFKQGIIKVIKTDKRGRIYGFIATEDMSDDIYFQESSIAPKYTSKLQKGSRVEMEVKRNQKGMFAERLWMIA
ncbi:hypothetical protein DSM106972_048560 [Dulcicalothrix desertica PCC 7102]|uniref:Cold-shock domain-containing protein n=1 Tax=Dulcicalothrix desertica PCC 7102 TaxID=232991 RepID=A0A3S1B368_9CYAN|nr:DUF2225 domain-containing protein [Dulcicalothrix desertica]RUT03942.1 hypothetical protein DSM106972_048560 [Dulcicalothrix desertica PCC 7102]TWH43652.1 Tfp pilus assembly protein PilF [Dulcicalothrix desertica PCC 7102]